MYVDVQRHTASRPFYSSRTFAEVRKLLLHKGSSFTPNLSEHSGTAANFANGYQVGYQMIMLLRYRRQPRNLGFGYALTHVPSALR